MKHFLMASLFANILLIVYILMSWTVFKTDNEQWKAEECLKGWTNSLCSLRDTVEIVFYGNSITCGGAFEKSFPDKRICNLGYPSDDLKGMRVRISQVMALHPTKVFVMGGINGLADQKLINFENEYDSLVKAMKDSLPKANIYLQSILPVNKAIQNFNVPSKEKIIVANRTIEKISKKYECKYIDLYSVYANGDVLPQKYSDDGVHLLPNAYNVWFHAIKDYVYE